MRKFILLLLLLLALPAGAATPLLLSAQHPWLTGHLALAIDETRQMTIESVVDADFKDIDGDLNLGFTRSAAWLRFTLINPTAVDAEWWLEVSPVHLSYVTLFVPRVGGGYDIRRDGNALVSSQRDLALPNPTFRLSLPHHRPQTFYMRVESGPALYATFNLWQPQDFAVAQTVNMLAWGAYVGLVLAFILSSLWFWRVTRDVEYAMLAAFGAATLVLRLLSGGGIQHWLLPDTPALRDPIMGCSLALSLAFGTSFINRFSNVAQYFPIFAKRFDQFVWVIACLGCIGFASDHYTETMPIVQRLSLLSIGVTAVMTALLVTRKQPQALTLLIALCPFWLIVPTRIAQMNGWITPSISGDVLMNISQVIYLGIMNFAGHQRYNTMRIENAQTQTLHEAVKRLEQANALERATHQAHRQFVATLSHELRNPLAVIDASVQNLGQLGGPAFDEKTRIRLDKIQGATDRLTLIIDECLTPERMDLPPMPTERQQVLLIELLSDAADTARLSSEAHNVSVQCDATLALSCNAELFKLALRTLADNAVKYTPAGTSIQLRGSIDTQAVLIEVADDGPGIDVRDLPEIFEKFYRGRATRHKPGTGLGLALAKQVIELHGGTIEAVNNAAGGVTFTIRIWLRRLDDYPCASPTSATPR